MPGGNFLKIIYRVNVVLYHFCKTHFEEYGCCTALKSHESTFHVKSHESTFHVKSHESTFHVKSHESTFHVNANRKSLEEYCFRYQVSTHLLYLSKPTINLRENLVQVVIFTVSLNELFENYKGRRTHVYSGRMTRLKYPP